MAQSIGYLLARVGPMFIGFMYGITHVWTVPLLILIGDDLLVVFSGIWAGREKFVLD